MPTSTLSQFAQARISQLVHTRDCIGCVLLYQVIDPWTNQGFAEIAHHDLSVTRKV